MMNLQLLRVALVVGAPQLASAWADDVGKTGTPSAVDTTRLALARSGADPVLIEVDLPDGGYAALTEPIAGWFNTVESYSISGASAPVWANREHPRVAMFGTPHSGTGDQLNVLRGEHWERWQIADLQRALVSPQLG